MAFIQVRISDEDKSVLEEAARIRGISLSDFMRQSARFAASTDYITVHIDAYAAMIDGLRRGGQIVVSDAFGRVHYPQGTESDPGEGQS